MDHARVIKPETAAGGPRPRPHRAQQLLEARVVGRAGGPRAGRAAPRRSLLRLAARRHHRPELHGLQCGAAPGRERAARARAGRGQRDGSQRLSWRRLGGLAPGRVTPRAQRAWLGQQREDWSCRQ
jgi:hypothetical protein